MTLIERLEAATGADRELDCAIELLLEHGRYDCPAGNWPTDAPRYTASLDAATSLVPPTVDPLDILQEALETARAAQDGVDFLPLHICIAALKARSCPMT
jgi:hypothetical protein